MRWLIGVQIRLPEDGVKVRTISSAFSLLQKMLGWRKVKYMAKKEVAMMVENDSLDAVLYLQF